MSVIKKICMWLATLFCDIEDFIYIKIRKLAEVIKFTDSRRKRIYSEYELSEEDKEKINKLYLDNYGKKVPFKWHRYYSSYTGHFDEKYFPEILYIPEFEHFMNSKNEYAAVFADKNFTPIVAKSVGIKTPNTICSCTNGVYRDENGCIIEKKLLRDNLANKGRLFFKPSIDSDSGRGCKIVEFSNDLDSVTKENVEDFISKAGNNWIIQEIVTCHKSLRTLSPDSVNTFRVMTYIWNNKVFNVPSILRIGRNGSFLDNAHAGGVFVAIGDNGELHEEAYTEFQERFKEHPDTHVKFSGYTIDKYHTVLESAKRMHEAIPQIGVINWDFTIDQNGDPILIEANTKNGGIWIFQMAHGCGPFGDNTAEILQWIRKMKKIRKSKRMYIPRGTLKDGYQRQSI